MRLRFDEVMRSRFDEVMKFKEEKKGRVLYPCELCPCHKECDNLPVDDYSCNDMYFAYITLGKNFDEKKEKICKTY